MATRAKELRYAVELAGTGALTEEKGVGLEVPAGWTPEHLLLAALVRCSLTSLAHHAGRAGLEVRAGSGAARALITKREEDGRYALVEADVEIAVELDPEPEDAAELLAKAERDCFIGASLRVHPRYRWTVNGRPAGP